MRHGFLHGFRKPKAKDEWLTPPHIVNSLGVFDLDPCSPVVRPWPTAGTHLTIEDDGLSRVWMGRVWMNPPYGDETDKWMRRLADHGNGIACVFARTETAWFFDNVWKRADAILFLRGRLSFCHVTGKIGGSAGAPSVPIAYGENNVECLELCGLNGHLIRLNPRKAEHA